MQPKRDHFDIYLTHGGILVTLLAAVMLAFSLMTQMSQALRDGDHGMVLQVLTFAPLVGFLIYGNLVYQAARLGYLRRRQCHRHRPIADRGTDRFSRDSAPTLTILVPSYKEEITVIRQTLISAALQAYPNKRVVLLLDDPPNPSSVEDRRVLEAARRLPADLKTAFCSVGLTLADALQQFRARQDKGQLIFNDEVMRLAHCYDMVGQWLHDQALTLPVATHTDQWFVQKILQEPGQQYRTRAGDLRAQAQRPRNTSSRAWHGEFLADYTRLNALFDVDFSVFERKRYRNLSHETE